MRNPRSVSKPAPVIADVAGVPAGRHSSETPLSVTGAIETTVSLVWRFFCSVRVSVYEIAFLTLLTLIGTLRGSVVPQWLADHVPGTAGLVDAWYGWNTFASWIYAATLALIAVGIVIGGMINRVPGIWRTIARPTVPTSPSFLRGTVPHAALTVEAAPDALADEIGAALRRRRYRVLRRQVGDAVHLYADRNRFGKLGTFPFHIALVMVVAGGIIVTQFGFRNVQFVIPEGQTVPVGHGTNMQVRLDSFDDDYYLDGTAKTFRSNVTVLDGDRQVVSGGVEPNHPLSDNGVTLFQSGFGRDVEISVADRAGKTLYTGPVTLGIYAAAANPDAPAGTMVVPGTNVTLNLIAPDQDPANRPDLDQLKLRPETLYVQARSADMVAGMTPPTAVIAPASPTRIGDVIVTFNRYGNYSVLQVAYYPGMWIFLVAAVLGVGGLLAVFYFPLRRIRCIVSPGVASGSAALLAPLARRDWSGKRDFVVAVDDLRERLKVPIQVSDQAESGR